MTFAPHVLRTILFCSLAVVLGGMASAHAQSSFEKSRIVFHRNLEAALNEAVQKYDGDLFIYFYDVDHPAHAQMDSVVFADATLSRYVNRNFGRLAVDMNTPAGSHLMALYTPNAEHEAPYIAVMSGHHMTHATFHGWENARASDVDSLGLTGLGRHWAALVSMKETGEPPARPGEAGWARWSARVKSLVAESRITATAGR